MPESVSDRPTQSHEHVFLFAKQPRYFYDADAIREPTSPASDFGRERSAVEAMDDAWLASAVGRRDRARLGNGSVGDAAGRNKRSVWTVATQPYPGAHFAVMPTALVEPMVLAGSPRRACGVCGAPHVRRVERSRTRNGVPLTGAWASNGGQRIAPSGVGHWRDATEVRTLGFEPSCACGGEAVPGTVLDPFAGACTTGVAALRLARAFVGIELNPDYAALGRRRLERWWRDEPRPVEAPQEATLF